MADGLLDGRRPGRAAARPGLPGPRLGGGAPGAGHPGRPHPRPRRAPGAAAAVRRPVARLRNRIETTIGELTEGLGLARHRAKTVWGLLTRAAATILAHTLLRLALV